MGKDQNGFTLVELVVTVAIMAIVMVSVCGFIVVASRSYASSAVDIMLQEEAQLAHNQISDVIIDATGSISYGDGTRMVLKDSEFGAEPAVKTLVVANRKEDEGGNPSYRFDWSREDGMIYLCTSDTAIDEVHTQPVFDESDRTVLAQHVTEFAVDLSQYEENGIVMISMTFENGGREYGVSYNVTVRNRAILNEINMEPLKKLTD